MRRLTARVTTWNANCKRSARIDTGGSIPDTDRLPAFTCTTPDLPTLPVLIAVPHAGRCYSDALLDRMRHPQLAGRRLEDRHVDRLARGVIVGSAASLQVADAPRAMIDLNRAPDDIDWGMIRHDARIDAPRHAGGAMGPRARAGLGLIPRRVPGLGEIWRGQHDLADVRARIACVHEPYHARIATELTRIRSRWGAALLIDLHSMPPLPCEGGTRGAEFVIGDRFGASADAALTAAALRTLAAKGRRATHNRPYAGGYVLDRHGHPEDGIHALQIEIDRGSYLDAGLDEPGVGFGDMVSLLIGLVATLGEATAVLGASRDGWTEAAE